MNVPEEYLSFIKPGQSTTTPSYDFDVFSPTFIHPTSECRSYTFLPQDPNPVIPPSLKDHLLSCFFTHFHRHFPMLLLPDFFELCYPICQHPSYLMNAIYAMGSVFSRHPAIVKREIDITRATTTLGNNFARMAGKQLGAIFIDDLDDIERPSYIIAGILLTTYQLGMNFNHIRDFFGM